ncbi:class I SAM-dependent methyltransferase [Lewinella sp. W8]|uniref:class I SAM-dependent methyltransferase n=1 Tax=Lewinella sp. W8 TaxID=2528208 RepID=UPI0010680FCE|nr:class I SAM-dependent methyltransferase [Lewinella sp. W8]MTB52776.1 methyltransferase domain-containing protein [Lewinella sp. W8]
MRFFLLAILSCLMIGACTEPPPPPSEDIFVPTSDEENRQRLIWQKPGAVIDAMGDVEEKVIADIGAGEGFFAQRLAQLADRVIAIEIDERYIQYLDTLKQFELPQKFQPRLEPRLATANDPNLEDREVDIILIVNTFLEINNQVDYLKKLFPALRPDGRIVIVDWKKKRTDIGPPQDKRVALYQLEEMLRKAGFHLVSSDDQTLEYQYIVVADKKVEKR